MPSRNLKLKAGDAALIVRQDLSFEGNIPKQGKEDKMYLNSMLVMSIATRLRVDKNFAQENITWMENYVNRNNSRIILAPPKEIIHAG